MSYHDRHLALAASLQQLLDLRRDEIGSEEIGKVLGITGNAARMRLHQHGISMHRTISPRVSVRPCMSCETPFISHGPHNRMCVRCRGFILSEATDIP